MEHFRAVCARTRDTVARNAKFNGSVERLFDVERRLGGNAVAALDVSTLADLGEAAERALHALGDWRAQPWPASFSLYLRRSRFRMVSG